VFMAAQIRIIVGQQGQGSALRDAQRDVRNLGDAAQRSSGGFNVLKGVGVAALGAVAVAAVGATAAIGGFVSDSIGAAGNFEAAVNGMAAVTGDSLTKAGFDFDDVRAKALQLGADTAFSAQEAIVAMTELAKGGVPVADVMGDATDATMALAAAAQLDLGPAAEIVAKQLGVWSETGVTATQVSDLLASAANASTVGVEDLALGLANAGGTAKTAGVSFEDLVQTMALIAPNFSSASDAGTSLKTFISRLIPTTENATEAMVGLGLATEDGKSKFFDATGTFIGMEDAARLLQSATADLSEEEKLLAFNTIFGSDAIRAAAAIANAGSDGFNAMGQSMEDAGGAAAAAAIQNQGFNFALEQMKGSMETLQIVIGSALLPVLSSLLNNYITPGINAAMTFAQAIMGNTDALRQLSPPLQLAATTLLSFAHIIQTGGFVELFTVFEDGTSAVSSLLERLGMSQPAALAINAAIASIISAAQPLIDIIGQNLTPIFGALAGMLGGALVAAIGSAVAAIASIAAPIVAAIAVGAALYAAWNSNFAGIRDLVTNVMNAVWGVISSIVSQVQAFWQQNGSQIQANTSQIWTSIQSIITTAVQLVQQIIVPVLQGIAAFITSHGSEIQAVFQTTWNLITGIIQTALNLIGGILEAALQLFQGDFEGAWNTIKQTSANFVRDLLQVIVSGLDALEAQFNLAIEAVRSILLGLVNDAGGIGSGIINNIIDGIRSGIGSLISAARDAAQAALDAALGALGIGGGGGGGPGFAAPGLSGGGAKLGPAFSGPSAGAAASRTTSRTVNFNPTYVISPREAQGRRSLDLAHARALAAM
jgi:trimeric autotransporter adhesin